MSMSDKQVRKMLLDTIEVLTNIPVKQRDRVAKSLDFKQQDDFCASMLLHAVECYTWNDYYELQAKREAEWQARRATEQAKQRDLDRSFHLCRQEAYHA